MTKSEKKPAKKTATPKTATAKAAVRSTSAKKTTPAKTTKASAKTSAKSVAAKKKAVKKPKFATADEMCAKLRKLIKNAKAVKADVAVDIEVWGLENDTSCHLYIEVKNGKVDVQPYRYDNCSFEAYINYENMMKLLDGKLTLKDAVSAGALNANGNIPAAVAIASIF